MGRWRYRGRGRGGYKGRVSASGGWIITDNGYREEEGRIGDMEICGRRGIVKEDVV